MIDYKTYHYKDQGINDCGWGCSYRNLQTILSCYKRYYDETIIIPNIQDLVLYFNKDINSNHLNDLWIEPYDISLYLLDYNKEFIGTNYLYIVRDEDIRKMLKTDIMIYLDSNTIYYKFEEIYELMLRHFRKSKLPIIIDDGTYSYGIIIKENKIYLIDPHMITDNNVKQIEKVFLENKFWMIYIPNFRI